MPRTYSGIDAVIAQLDERLEGAEPVAEARHVAHVAEIDAVLRGAHERLDVGLWRSPRRSARRDRRCRRRRRRGRTAPAASAVRCRAWPACRANAGFGSKPKVPRARAVAADAVDRERAGLAADGEVHRAVAPGSACRPALRAVRATSCGRASSGRRARLTLDRPGSVAGRSSHVPVEILLRAGLRCRRLADAVAGRRRRPHRRRPTAARRAAIGRNTAIDSATATASPPRRERRAVARGVEDREQPVLQLPRARHAERGRGRRHRAERSREIEEVTGVLARARAGREHQVVARQLALRAQPPRRPPDARVRPVQRARQGGESLHEAVAPRDVRQLVQQHGAAAVVGPRVGGCGQHEGRTPGPVRHRHQLAGALQQPHRPSDARLPRRFVEEAPPRRVVDLTRGARQAPQHERFPAEPHQQQQHTAGIQRRRGRRARSASPRHGGIAAIGRGRRPAQPPRPTGDGARAPRPPARRPLAPLAPASPGARHRRARDGNAHRPVRQRVGRDRQHQQRRQW